MAACSAPALEGETAASPPPAPGSLTTNAVTRNFSDLHTPTWLGLLSGNIAARTLLFHPIHLAISRKRVTRDSPPPTVWGLMQAAYRGGHTSAYGPASTVGQHTFGHGGLRGLYRGVGAALLCNLAGETSYLFTLEALKEYVASPKPRGSPAADGVLPAPTSASTRDGGNNTYTTFAASSWSTAVGAMCGDLVALLLVTPLVIVCNRQMTAGYGMAAPNKYMTIPRTLVAVWDLYQIPTPPASAAAAKASATGAGAQHSTATANSIHRVGRLRRGFSGLYQGLSAGLLRIPSSGCWWGLYTKSKEVIYTTAAPTLSRWEQEHLDKAAAAAEGVGPAMSSPPASPWRQNWLLSPTDNPLLNAVAGVVASVCTTVLFNPIMVIQTRQQSLPPHFWVESTHHASAGGAATTAAAPQRRSWKTSLLFRRVYHVASDLVRKEGFRGLFKGSVANTAVAVMDGIIFTLLFEFTKLGSDVQFLEQRSHDAIS